MRIAPMIKKSDPMPRAEIKRAYFRPRVSTRKNTVMVVATTLMTPYIPDAKRELRTPT